MMGELEEQWGMTYVASWPIAKMRVLPVLLSESHSSPGRVF